MKRAIMILAASLFALAACDNKPADPKTDDTASKNATTTGASATVVPATPPTISEGDLSTPADFEEVAEKGISKSNYKTELASLDSEIAKE